MPDVPVFKTPAGSRLLGGTLFERMQRTSNAPRPSPTTAEPFHGVHAPFTANQDIVVVEQVDGAVGSGGVRFDRADVDGLPGIVMQKRQEDGAWHDIWSLPTQSIDAREGMFGWLNTQSQRWDRFERMLQRRGADELTNWIFELMVQPTAAAARPPRLQPQAWATIDQYSSPHVEQSVRFAGRARVDNCICRHNPRDF